MRAAQRSATTALLNLGHHEIRNAQHQEDRQTERAVEYERLIEKADDLCEQFRMTTCSPALSVAIAVNGTMVYTKAFGCLDVENQIPATPDMKFRVASISKPFAAHAWMKILQDNKDFASKVKDDFGYRIQELIQGLPQHLYKLELPESLLLKRWRLEDESDEVPVTALLSHTSGYANTMLTSERQTFTACNSETQAFMHFSGHYNFYNRQPNSPIASYSNFNTRLLAAIIERFIPGIYRNYTETLMHEMGMRDSYFLRQDEIHPDYMSGYRNGHFEGMDEWGGPAPSGFVNEYLVDMSSRFAPEGVVSTASELVRFGNVYARGYLENFEEGAPEVKAPLTNERIMEMFSNYSQTLCDAFPSSSRAMTLGWFRRDTVERCEPDENDELKPHLLRQTLWHGGLGYGSSGVLGCTFYNIECEDVDYNQTSPNAYLNSDDADKEVTMLALSLPSCEEVSQAGFVSAYHYLPEEERELLDAFRDVFRRWKRRYERFIKSRERAVKKTEEQIDKLTAASRRRVLMFKERHLAERHRVVLRMAGLRNEILADEARLQLHQQWNGSDPLGEDSLSRKKYLYHQKIVRARTELSIAHHRILKRESEWYLARVVSAQESLSNWISQREKELADSIAEFIDAEITMKELLDYSERGRCENDILEIFGAGTTPPADPPSGDDETRESEAEIWLKRNFAKLKSYFECAGGPQMEETDRVAADALLRLLLRYRPLPETPRDERPAFGGDEKIKLRRSALVRNSEDERVEPEVCEKERGSVVVAVLANHVIITHQLFVEQLTNLFGEFYIRNPREG